MVYETKKTFEIYEISSIRNVFNTLFTTDDIFYTQQRNFKTLIGGGGGTKIHPSTPTPSLLPLVKKIGITSHRISRNTAKFCIDLHRKISQNFAKFGPFSNVYETKKNIRNIRNFEYTKCRKHPKCQALAGRFSSVHITSGFRKNFQDHRRLPVCILRVGIAAVGPLKRINEMIFSFQN